MKEIQTKFLKYSNAIIVGLLAILGFASCCDNDDVEYGTPSATFIVRGKVTSIETQEAIKNIKVIVHGDTSIGYYWNRDTTVTDNEGNYVIDKHGFPENRAFKIQFQDIDSLLNGEYQNLDTIIEFNNPVFTGGDGDWYVGETTKEINIKLIPKK
jgi:putative lipoprotein (rSAM/lipoprotein system)